MGTGEVILVTTNFRLGSLGFMALDNEVSGNQGLRDQVAALQWVRDNIAVFGGDRERVTLFGQGSGSWMTGYLLLSPLAHGLFQGAILQSMVHWGGPAFDTSTRKQAEERGEELVHSLSCSVEGRMACLRRKTGDEVILAGLGGNLPLINVDGYFLQEHPIVLLAQGRYNKVPIIIGATSRDGIGLSTPQNLQSWTQLAQIWMPGSICWPLQL